jgi:uncharacterized protein (TIGR00369 family)
MDQERLDQLLDYLRTRVNFSRHIGLVIERIEPGRAVFSLQVETIHMNGAGTVHGGVHASLMDSAMAVALLTHGVRASTTQMNVHFVEAVREGRIVCTGEVVHRARRTALTEAKVHDESGRLLATATGAFRIYEGEGPIGGQQPSSERANS